jgi:hypothetical protein
LDLLPLTLSHAPVAPFSFVKTEADPEGHPCPLAFQERVMIDTIHDGNHVPEAFLVDKHGQQLPADVVQNAFVVERDWGAESVASALASALHIDGYYRVNLARMLVDFGRFPGVTSPSANHIERLAINPPFSTCLSHDQKRNLLVDYYDQISRGMELAIRGKILKIAIHTYDENNFSATRRPAVSILTRSHGHTWDAGRPLLQADPIFPHEIAEFTADRILRTRIALALEEAAIHSDENYPYTLPEGSVEIRSQVWFFFQHVRTLYEAAHPDRKGSDAQELVWDMLLDTNLRDAQSDALRSYIHMFRRPPDGAATLFAEARQCYEDIAHFVEAGRDELVSSYRNDLDHPNSILIEVRKDLLSDYQGTEPTKLNFANARLIGRTLADAVATYIARDRPLRGRTLSGHLGN